MAALVEHSFLKLSARDLLQRRGLALISFPKKQVTTSGLWPHDPVDGVVRGLAGLPGLGLVASSGGFGSVCISGRSARARCRPAARQGAGHVIRVELEPIVMLERSRQA